MKYPESKRALKVALLSSVMTATVMASQSALAQDAGDNSALEEIVVTATKRETSLMDTPIAISAFTEDALDKLGIKNIKDLNNLVPNMSIMVDVESSAPIITMRGIRSTNTTEWGDPAVGVHFDGIYSPRPQGALALMFDIERAEVMRGPQGTLFGRNSTVGSVNIISKKPDFDEFSGKVQVEYGRWNQRALKGVLNIPVDEKLALRFAGVVEKQDSNLTGYWDPNQWDTRYLQELGIPFVKTDSAVGTGVNDWNNRNFFRDNLYEAVPVTDKANFYNNKNNYAFRMVGLWKPTDNFEWSLTYEHFRDDSAGNLNTRDCARIADRPASVNGGSCTDIYGSEDNFETYVNIPGISDTTMNSVRSHAVWEINDYLQLVSNFGWQNQKRTGQIDLDQGMYLWDQMLKWIDTDYTSYSNEIQLQSVGDNKLQWIAGYFNFGEDNFMNGQYHGAMGGVSSWQQPKRTIDSEAFFGQATYEVTEKLFLTLGARHTKDTKADEGGRNYGCWDPACYTDVAWAEVWGDIDWSKFGTDGTISDDPLNVPGTNSVRARLNALPTNYYDAPNSSWNTDTENDAMESWSKTTWRIGLDYDVNDDTMIYGYVANGYKGGGIGDVLYLISDPTVKYDTRYDPETIVTYELGVKAKLLDGKMNLRANAFYSDYTGQQFTTWEIFDSLEVEIPDPLNPGETITDVQELGTFLTRNASKSAIMGLELEMEWAAWENGNIGGYVTFMDTELKGDFWKKWGAEGAQVFEGYDPNNGAQQVLDTSFPWFRNLKGNDLAYAPHLSLTLNVSHDFHFSNGGTLTPFLNVHYESSSYVDIENRDKWTFADGVIKDGVDLDVYSDKRDAWALANFNMRYSSANEEWFVEGYVNNLTNADVNWWQSYAGSTPIAAKARQTYGMRAGVNF